MSETIFISYRRSDAGGHALHLFDRLSQWFDAGVVFYDQDSIDMGAVFPERIAEAVQGAAVVLVLIGPDWLAEINRRVSQPGVDFVRREVQLALARHRAGAPLLPVLLNGAAMPAAHQFHADLQADLAPLCAINAHPFHSGLAKWHDAFVQLREKLAQTPGVPAPRYRPPAGVTQPFRVIEHLLSPHFQDPNGLLGRLQAQLDAGGRAAILARAALYGMGGVGKTQLALKYSQEYRDLYAGVWWFRAESASTLQLDAQACCQAVGLAVADGEDAAGALKRWLENQKAAWLLVYDNAEAVNDLVPYLPQTGSHHLLITSRNPAWGGLAKPVELETWSPEHSADFLNSRLPAPLTGSDPSELAGLGKDLGGLPLALEQAASYIEHTQCGVSRYRQLLADFASADKLLDKDAIGRDGARSVAATLSLAFDRLTLPAQQLLRLCAFAAAEPLPERIFLEARERLPEALAQALADALAWDEGVGELIAYGLAERTAIPALDRAPGAAATEPALSLHRLTQQTTRTRLAQPETDCRVFASVLRAACPADAELPNNWLRYAALAEHIDQLERFREPGWLDTRAYCGLLDRLATYFQKGPALYAESVRLFRRALEINRRELGEEHPDTLSSMNNLAFTLGNQGDLTGARALQEQVLAASRRVQGEEHPDTLSSMNNLAGTLGSQGDLASARALEEQVLAARRRVLGEEHPDTLSSMNNLAGTLWDQGDLAGARALQEQVLAARRRVLGEEHPNTLTSMNNLASTLKAQGDLAGARALQEPVLAANRRVLGEEHPNTLTGMNNLASTLWNQGDLAGARALEEPVLAARRRVLGEEHPDTLTSMNNLAITLWQMDEHLPALQLMRGAAEGRARRLGPAHPHTQGSVNAVEQMRATLQQAGLLPEGAA